MRLIPIPTTEYDEYRINLIFDCYKWDPQFLDNNTIAKYALVLTKEEHKELEKLTLKLDEETRRAENFLNLNSKCSKSLKLPRKIKKEIKSMKNYEPDRNIRLMRFDFHPTVDEKWAVSEVNSDVPGGYAEGSLMPLEAMKYLEEKYSFISFGDILVGAITKKVPKNGRVMLVHCTCYSDDRQVMQYLGDRLKAEGYTVIYGAADHVRFKDNKAYCILDGNEGNIDVIVRFDPIEWLIDIKPKKWQGYFNTVTTSCNHPIAIFAQTKRFPFVWDELEKQGMDFSGWRELLPETISIKELKKRKDKEMYIFKPANGRVGEKISIKEACRDDEYKKILLDVKLRPWRYVAQKRFESKPLKGEQGEEYHVCIGSYTVDGCHGGYYARISDTPRIDSNAADIPVLIEGDLKGHKSIENGKESIKEAYKIWAPEGNKWSGWVRPVPFLSIGEKSKKYINSNITLPIIEYDNELTKKTAVMVDLSGTDSVLEGLALAKKGYRPIPTYNGTMEQKGARAAVDNQSIGEILLWGAKELADMKLEENFPPAFLLDKNRLQRYKINGAIFDNSYDIYPQDLPTAEYLVSNGIDRVVIVCDSSSKDLKKIIKTYKKKKLVVKEVKRFG